MKWLYKHYNQIFSTWVSSVCYLMQKKVQFTSKDARNAVQYTLTQLCRKPVSTAFTSFEMVLFFCILEFPFQKKILFPQNRESLLLKGFALTQQTEPE